MIAGLETWNNSFREREARIGEILNPPAFVKFAKSLFRKTDKGPNVGLTKTVAVLLNTDTTKVRKTYLKFKFEHLNFVLCSIYNIALTKKATSS